MSFLAVLWQVRDLSADTATVVLTGICLGPGESFISSRFIESSELTHLRSFHFLPSVTPNIISLTTSRVPPSLKSSVVGILIGSSHLLSLVSPLSPNPVLMLSLPSFPSNRSRSHRIRNGPSYCWIGRSEDGSRNAPWDPHRHQRDQRVWVALGSRKEEGGLVCSRIGRRLSYLITRVILCFIVSLGS